MSRNSIHLWRIIVVFIVLFLGLARLTERQADMASSNSQKDNSHLCYFVAANAVTREEALGYVDRQMTILMDAKNFTEATLRRLARELLEKYPTPDRIDIAIYSHIDQIPRQLEETEPNEALSNYPSGGVDRFEGNEVIRYTLPPGREWKTIILKGRDLAEPEKK